MCLLTPSPCFVERWRSSLAQWRAACIYSTYLKPLPRLLEVGWLIIMSSLCCLETQTIYIDISRFGLSTGDLPQVVDWIALCWQPTQDHCNDTGSWRNKSQIEQMNLRCKQMHFKCLHYRNMKIGFKLFRESTSKCNRAKKNFIYRFLFILTNFQNVVVKLIWTTSLHHQLSSPCITRLA